MISVEKIQNYVNRYLAEKDELEASQLPLNNEEDFIKLIYVRLYGQRKNMGYVIETLEEREANRISYIPSDINLANAESYLMNALSRETVMKRILTNENLTDYDCVLIDCLPSLGILLVNALTASDNVIIPVQTQKFAYEGLGSLINICEQVKETINKSLEVSGIIATMAENTKMSRNTLEMLDTNYKDLLYKTAIHKSVEAANSSERNRSLCLNKSKLGEEYKALAEEIMTRC